MKPVSLNKLVRPHLANVKTYDPVDPPEVLAKQAGVPEDRIIKLNGNENPYGASPKAAKALANIPLHVYPDPLQRNVRGALAQYTGLGPEHLIAGAGSDELIDLLFRLFISPGDAVLDFEPTFGMYGFCARLADAEIKLVPRDDDFEIDVEAVEDAVDARTKIVFVSSPNNPTGNKVSDSQVKALLDTGLVVVVDEAYYEFSGHTVAKLVSNYENLVVLRTMSKWAGLAGLRVGYGIMSGELVRHIIDIKSPYNVSVAAEAALLASLQDSQALLDNVAIIVGERERMYSFLEGLPGVKPWPSSGNFILCQFGEGRADTVHDGLARRGIFVRKFNTDRLADCFRITVGTPEQTDAVIAAMKDITAEDPATSEGGTEDR